MGFSRKGYWSGLPFPSPGVFPTQGSNPGLLHCRQALSCLSHQGSPYHVKGDLKWRLGVGSSGCPVLYWAYFMLPSLLLSRSVMLDSLRPHGLQHTRLPHPSPFPGACSNSCPLSQWVIQPSCLLWQEENPLLLLPSVFSSFKVFSNEGSSHQMAKVLLPS